VQVIIDSMNQTQTQIGSDLPLNNGKPIFVKNTQDQCIYKIVKKGDYWQTKGGVKSIPKTAQMVITMPDNTPLDGHFIGSDAHFHRSQFFAEAIGLYDLGSHYHRGDWITSFTEEPSQFWLDKTEFEKTV